MITVLLAIHSLQKSGANYPSLITADLLKVQKFVAEADDVITMVSDRVLDRDQNIKTIRDRLLSGKSIPMTSLGQKPDSRISVLRGKEIKFAVEYVKALTNPPIEGPARCFFPRHLIFARRGAEWIDIEICYECVAMRIESNDGKTSLLLGMNRNSRELADKFFGYKSKNSKA